MTALQDRGRYPRQLEPPLTDRNPGQELPTSVVVVRAPGLLDPGSHLHRLLFCRHDGSSALGCPRQGTWTANWVSSQAGLQAPWNDVSCRFSDSGSSWAAP